MRPINLKIIKRDNFSKILEEEWGTHNSLESVFEELQKIKGNIEEIKIDYWVNVK